jgi:integrase
LVGLLDGIDPMARSASVTVQEFGKQFLTSKAGKVKPVTVKAIQQTLKAVGEVMGSLMVDQVQRTDVMKAHALWTSERGPYAANRNVRILGGMFGLAEDMGLRPQGTNPAKRIQPNPETPRTVRLTAAEISRLGAALEAEPNDPPTEAIRLLIFTGARRREIERLTWAEVDVAGGRLWLKDSKTGPRQIALSVLALEIIQRQDPQEGSPYVFPSPRKKQGVRLQETWDRIRTKAALPKLRIHDLRHVFLSRGANIGLSLFQLGKLAGHSTQYMTERYAHEENAEQRRVADAVAESIDSSLKGKR